MRRPDDEQYNSLKLIVRTVADEYQGVGGERIQNVVSSLRILLWNCRQADAQQEWEDAHPAAIDSTESGTGYEYVEFGQETEKES